MLSEDELATDLQAFARADLNVVCASLFERDDDVGVAPPLAGDAADTVAFSARFGDVHHE